MNNEAILSVLNSLCSEARNSAHAAFALVEMHRNAASDPSLPTALETGTTNADRLLRSLEDLRELLSSSPAAPRLMGEFDLAVCLRETIELLNLASGERAAKIHMEASPEPLMTRQDRQALEQALTRTLDAAARLSGAGELLVTATAGPGGNGVRVAITPQNSGVAERLSDWLNADPENAAVQSDAEASLGLAVMLAGKRLRALGGRAEVVRDSIRPARLAIHIHSRPDSTGREDGQSVRRHSPDPNKLLPRALNILVTEDSDDSYALTELLFKNETVWRARDGLEAVNIVKKRRFDVVFMDVHMPGMDGYATIRAIREWETMTANARTPIVVLSSDDLETQRHSAAQSGCSGFLRKPLRKPDLTDLLDRLRTTPSLVS